MSKIYRPLLSWGLIALFIGASLALQLNILISSDTSWLIEVGRRLLSGQHYYTQIFEVNPPLAPLLYSPCLAIAKLFHLSLRHALVSYLFILLGCCFWVARYTLIKLHQTTAIPYYTLLTGIAFIEFLLFTYSFSEREQLMLALTLPYFMTTIYRLIHWRNKQGKPALSTGILVLIGVMAGIGFCLKPYFFLAYLLVELYLIQQRRSLLASLRIESITPILLGACYVALTGYFFPNYLFKVVPLSQKLYLPYYNLSWLQLLNSPLTYYTLITLALSLYPRSNPTLKTIYRVLALALSGFYFSYLLQLKPWYYHQLPCLAIGCLLQLLLCHEAISLLIKKQHRLIAMTLLVSAIYLILFPVSNAIKTANLIIDYSHSPNSPANRFSRFINQYHYHGYLLDLSPSMAPATYITQLTPLKYGSRYGNATILLVGILHLEQTAKPPVYLAAAKHYFLSSIEQDLKHHKPCYILVSVGRHKEYFGKLHVNLLAYLQQSKPLDRLLTHYRKVMTYEHFALYAPPS